MKLTFETVFERSIDAKKKTNNTMLTPFLIIKNYKSLPITSITKISIQKIIMNARRIGLTSLQINEFNEIQYQAK